MIKETKRKAFNFLRSYFDVLNELKTDKDKLEFLMAVINKQFLNEEPKDLSFLANLCYQSQRHQIESSVKGWERATNDTLRTTLPTTLPTTPLTPSEEEEEKGKEKGKEELLKRKKEFINQVKEYHKSNPDKYPKQLYSDFVEYWTERGLKDKKFRFEKEKTFGLSGRLSRWSKNGFNDYTLPKKKPTRVDPNEYLQR